MKLSANDQKEKGGKTRIWQREKSVLYTSLKKNRVLERVGKRGGGCREHLQFGVSCKWGHFCLGFLVLALYLRTA